MNADILDLTDNATGKKKEGYINMSSATLLDIPIKSEAEVRGQITQSLENEEKVYYSDSLILDAYNYILQGRYNECIIISNIALEIFVLELLREVLRTKFEYDYEVNQALKNVREKKLHPTMRKNFFAGRSHEELIQNNEIYIKFHEARKYREQVIHHGMLLEKLDAEKNINTILEVNKYLVQNVSTFAGDILKRARFDVNK